MVDDRWGYPIQMGMQRQTGSAPKPRAVKSPPVAPEAEARQMTSDDKPDVRTGSKADN